MTEHKQEELEEKVTKPRKKLKKKHKITIAGLLVIVILLIAAGTAWLYTGNLTAAKEKIFRTVSLPIAMVQSTSISSTELYQRVDLAKIVLDKSGEPTDNLESQLLDQLIETKKINIIAARENVVATDEDINSSYEAIVARFPSNSETDIEKTLADAYGMDLKTFKNEVVRQSVIQQNLKLWFAQQENLNGDQYNKARDLVKQLDSGTSFEEVAKKYSEDVATKDFAGDSGFIKYGDMLPEFKTALKDLTIGDTKIVASRAGIHIIRVNAIEGDNSNQDERSYNLQQIYIEPADFIAWLDTQTKNIKAVKLL